MDSISSCPDKEVVLPKPTVDKIAAHTRFLLFIFTRQCQHKRLNSCRDVSSGSDLLTTPDAEILDGFSDQVIQSCRLGPFTQLAVIPDAIVKTESVDTAVQEVTNVLIAAADLSIQMIFKSFIPTLQTLRNADSQTAYKNQRKLWGNFFADIPHYGEYLGV
ncbi:hypothetical protein TNCV_3668111 [Trichonephila clavipes]|nr:hypothetical protein TNCV_3668111 [Trichonephila clavipes]